METMTNAKAIKISHLEKSVGKDVTLLTTGGKVEGIVRSVSNYEAVVDSGTLICFVDLDSIVVIGASK
jgi:hypothetical protein